MAQRLALFFGPCIAEFATGPSNRGDTLMTEEKNLTPSRPWQLNVAVALLALLVAISLFQSWNSPQSAVRWEYKVWTGSDATLPETINALGSDGWELVFARRASGNPDNPKPDFQYEMIFRRPARSAGLIKWP